MGHSIGLPVRISTSPPPEARRRGATLNPASAAAFRATSGNLSKFKLNRAAWSGIARRKEWKFLVSYAGRPSTLTGNQVLSRTENLCQ